MKPGNVRYKAVLTDYKIPAIIGQIIILTISLVILTSCGFSQIPIPEKSFISSDSEALVIGRLQVFANGKSIEAKGSGLLDALKISVFEYVSVQEAIHTRRGKDISSNNIRISREDGYFTVKLRPGKYFVLAFGLTSNPITESLMWAYPIRGLSSNICNARNNEIIIITVEPGQANYIGTIKTILSTNHEKLVEREIRRENIGDYTRIYYQKVLTRMWGIDKTQLVNEAEIAKDIFKELYPDHPPFVTNPAKILVVSQK